MNIFTSDHAYTEYKNYTISFYPSKLFINGCHGSSKIQIVLKTDVSIMHIYYYYEFDYEQGKRRFDIKNAKISYSTNKNTTCNKMLHWFSATRFFLPFKTRNVVFGNVPNNHHDGKGNQLSPFKNSRLFLEMIDNNKFSLTFPIFLPWDCDAEFFWLEKTNFCDEGTMIFTEVDLSITTDY